MRVVGKTKILLVLPVVTAFFGVLFFVPSAYADTPSIIINEIMYNPASDVSDDEYLELYNTTDTDIDLSGWCFTAGIGGCFDSSTILAAHSYGLVSPNAAQTLTTYSQTTIGTYTGNLSNGGETVTLSDNTSQIINSITYDDSAPWPTSPDGSGPSLELRGTDLDNSLANSWSGSITPTPRAQNSLVGIIPPVISATSHPDDVQANDAVLITTEVEDAESVTLSYKIMFDTDIEVSMNDSGTDGDSTADDGIYSAEIPGQAAGKLVRYKIEAENSTGSITDPSPDETINYYGYVVQYDVQAGALPRLEWFIANDDYTALTNAGDSDEYFPAVIAYGNTVIDNVEIRLKGNYSRTFPKKPYKVKLPKGYSLTMPEISQYPLKEFHLNSDFPNGNFYISSILSWRAFKAAGFAVPQFRKIQLQRNGEFEGTYLLADKYDDEWQDIHTKYKTGDMYDAWWEDHNPGDNDTAARNAWKTDSLSLTGDQLHKYIRDNYDIPNIINFLAVSTVIRHHDWSAQQNLIVYKDSDRTQRWSIYPWDLDLTFNESYGTLLNPAETPDYLDPSDRFFASAIWNDPELKSMYLRRVRELADQILKSGQAAQWAEEDWQDVQSSAQLDFDKWNDFAAEQAETDAVKQYIIDNVGLDPDSPEVVAGYYQTIIGDEWVDAPDPLTEIAPATLNNRIYFKFMVGIARMTKISTEDLETSGDLPKVQPANSRIRINEIMYNPSDGDDYEYVELYNPNTFAVDVSNWKIKGVSMTLPPGSVISGKGYAVVVKNDSLWRQQYGGDVIVLGEYNGKLSNLGETITLTRANNTVSDSVAYSSSTPWPQASKIAGKSLERISDSCWAASKSTNGSPGQPNESSSNSNTYLCTKQNSSSSANKTISNILKAVGVAYFKQVADKQAEQPTEEDQVGHTSSDYSPDTDDKPKYDRDDPTNSNQTKPFNKWILLGFGLVATLSGLFLYKMLAKHKHNIVK